MIGAIDVVVLEVDSEADSGVDSEVDSDVEVSLRLKHKQGIDCLQLPELVPSLLKET
eukprot:CAMPEP_0180809418 /NCGR_PEP_ID=MMETSP1038_2-20121128/64315_1 /TAXON_ID=632150 /ORGANISM="Azadinium spinosum, Strain 3D9" /LENGTH=56 /DNA_ID=CAMNT_0022850589 /DNA_START=79 /DNA_END=249 /DNA_ORIENTATION=+